MSVFRKGSYRYKIVEGLRVLPQENVAKFMQIFGVNDGSKTVFEVVRDIPDKDLKSALVIVERSEEKHRKKIQNAAKKYIDDINRAGGNPTYEENLAAVKASVEIAGTDVKNIGHTVTTMNEMSHEIILGAVDDLIERKKPKNLSYEPTPEEIERFISGMKEGIDPNTGVKVSKIGFFGEPANYGMLSDLVLRSDGSVPSVNRMNPEFFKARSALAAEILDLRNMTRNPGWFDDDTPAIPESLLVEAQRILYHLPPHDRYLPKSISVVPTKSTVVLFWVYSKKSVQVTIGGTDVPWLHYIEYVNKAMPQDHDERFSELSDVTMFVLIKFLDRMFT